MQKFTKFAVETVIMVASLLAAVVIAIHITPVMGVAVGIFGFILASPAAKCVSEAL
jgi:hypothetical protein